MVPEAEMSRGVALPGSATGVESQEMHRWRILLGALAGTAVLAVSFGVAVDRVVSASPPPPHLKTVSDSILSSAYGVTLAAAVQPPYCGVQQAGAKAGWLKPGGAGCPISRDAAESAAMQTNPGSTVESLLARVTSSQNTDVHNRLTWLVVVRGSNPRIQAGSLRLQPMICGARLQGYCVQAVPPAAANRVVFIDAYSGQYLQLYPQFSRFPIVPIRSRPIGIAAGAAQQG